MTSSLVKAAPPSAGFGRPQNGAAVRYQEEPPSVGSTRGEGTLTLEVFAATKVSVRSIHRRLALHGSCVEMVDGEIESKPSASIGDPARIG